ncbi:hypothetical protein MHN80_16795 [Gordonia McavH-238-E]|uniref:hypothetical protein n=1 Tax=Gordonia sp. McavH-238-E TaxID=2917736 RepID=UPI001EF54F08|nr:hypothetical protein [Gordonia sp. McavH-238-E]MCG7633969.1 hypothetical protein [Gordonia sp. McavH-238-E]
MAIAKWQDDNKFRHEDEANQARLVAVLTTPDGAKGIRNRSPQPIYDVHVRSIISAADHQPLLTIGQFQQNELPAGDTLVLAQFNAGVNQSTMIGFTDANGRRWYRIGSFAPQRLTGKFIDPPPKSLFDAHMSIPRLGLDHEDLREGHSDSTRRESH